MVRIKRVKVSASKSRLTSIRRPLASNTSKARLLSALPLRRLRATFTSTSRSHSPCPPASLRRLFNARCNVLSAKPWLLQNSTCRCPLASNSVTRRLISWLPRRFRTLTSSLSVMPRVDQNRAGVPRWVRLTDTFVQRFGFGVVAHTDIKQRQIVKASRSIWMLGAEHFLANLQSLLIKRFSFGVLAHIFVELR